MCICRIKTFYLYEMNCLHMSFQTTSVWKTHITKRAWKISLSLMLILNMDLAIRLTVKFFITIITFKFFFAFMYSSHVEFQLRFAFKSFITICTFNLLFRITIRDAAGRPGHGSGRVNQFLLRAGSGRVSKFWNFHGSGRVGSVISKISTGRVGSRVIGFFSRVITGQLEFVAGRHGST